MTQTVPAPPAAQGWAGRAALVAPDLPSVRVAEPVRRSVSSAARLRRALSDLSAGRAVVLQDDRTDEGQLVVASERASAELVAFLVRFTTGFLTVAMTEQDADRLELPPMVAGTEAAGAAVPAVTVDAREGIGTGISARDRAHTIRLLASAGTHGADLARPGHVVPLRVGRGGVLRHPGRAEAALDLAMLAGVRPSATLAGIVSEQHPTGMAGGSEVRRFAVEHRLAQVSIQDLVVYRQRFDTLVERVAEASMPLDVGTFTAIGYRGLVDGRESIALVHGDVGDGDRGAGRLPVHVHRECVGGDVLGSAWCPCGTQLRAALRDVVTHGCGVVLYQRGPDRASDGSAGSACPAGRPPARVELAGAGQILRDLGVDAIRLVGGDAGLRLALEDQGLDVGR